MRYLALLTLALSCSGSVAAQELLRTHEGRDSWRLSQLSSLPDVDGDGVGDILLSSSTWRDGCSGRLIVYSGGTGELIRLTCSQTEVEHMGETNGSIGDFDGDGVGDYAVGDPNNAPFEWHGEVEVYSGATGDLLAIVPNPDPNLFWYQKFGVSELVGLGDLTGDGRDEFFASFQFASRYYIIEGGTGVPLRWGEEDNQVHPLPVGDADGDGVPDYALVSFDVEDNWWGLVTLRSGADGSLIYDFAYPADVTSWFDDFGRSACTLADQDGDGVKEILVSASYCSGWCFPGPQPIHPGAAWVMSGATGQVLGKMEGSQDPELFAEYSFRFVRSGGDVNGDGWEDWIAIHPEVLDYDDPSLYTHPADGSAFVYSGRTFAQLWHSGQSGNDAEIFDDLDGDGLAEWGYTLTANQPFNGGQLRIFRGFPGDAEPVCSSLPNSTGQAATLRFDGAISLGNNHLNLVVEGAVPNALAWFAHGPDLIQVPFGDGLLCIGGGTSGIQRFHHAFQLDAQGAAFERVDLTAPAVATGPSAWTPGSTWTLQCLYRDPLGPGASGWNLTDAMRVTWTP